MSLSSAHRNAVAAVAICLAALMFGLEISSVPAVLPTLEKELHAGFSGAQWVMNAYTIACTTVLMAAGTLADRYGRRRVLLLSVLAFGLTSLACGWARDASVLIAARFLQGMSGGAMVICQIAALSHQFQHGTGRSRAFAAWGIIFGVGLGFGPMIGSAIAVLLDWTWVFLIQAPLALLTMALVAWSVDESRDPEARHLDVAGMLSMSLAVFGLTFFITQGPALGMGSPATLGALSAAVASFIVFVYVEKHRAHPMFDFAVFRIRPFAGALCGSMGMNFSFWPFMIYLPIYFQSVLGYGTVATGTALLAYTLPTLVVPPLAERLTVRYRPRAVIPAGLFTIGLGFLVMQLHGSTSLGLPALLSGCVLAGIGLGMTNTPVTNTTTGAVPAARAGMASGIDMSARLITLAINIALMGFLLIEGVMAYLRHVGFADIDPAVLRDLANRMASGDPASLGAVQAGTAAVAHDALKQGFRWVMLYAGVGAWVLAIASFVTFGPASNAAIAPRRYDDQRHAA
ncbi:MFS transporter [Dyella sp. BiH032]|uniref:MFS transporter n=1 Tax=Dyella sp. BiH032 TaxID=3075430 RepID=UPI0028937042|nr:MFS transporter [Dyella sp. BiH032]WNL45756.1 MFS transporter [Dyella sp. BiH032]